MSGETERNISGWTTDTLHALVEKLFTERDARYATRFEATDAAHDTLSREIALQRQILETRLAAMDKAGQLLYENLVRVPTDVDRAVMQLRELLNEKIHLIDSLTSQRFTDNRSAVDSAFAAAKEAVGKSEISTTKEIDALKVLIGAQNNAFDDKISDLRQSRDQNSGHKSGFGDAVSVVYAVVTILAIVLTALVVHFVK